MGIVTMGMEAKYVVVSWIQIYRFHQLETDRWRDRQTDTQANNRDGQRIQETNR